MGGQAPDCYINGTLMICWGSSVRSATTTVICDVVHREPSDVRGEELQIQEYLRVWDVRRDTAHRNYRTLVRYYRLQRSHESGRVG